MNTKKEQNTTIVRNKYTAQSKEQAQDAQIGTVSRRWRRIWGLRRKSPSYLCPLGKKGDGVLCQTAQVDCMDAGGRATQEQLPRSTP